MAALGGTLAQGRATAAALEGISRNPGAAPRIQTAMILGLALIAVSVRAAVERSLPAARRLFLASLVYLPSLFCLLVLDRR